MRGVQFPEFLLDSYRLGIYESVTATKVNVEKLVEIM